MVRPTPEPTPRVEPNPEPEAPTLYKAHVRIRWRNRVTGQWNNIAAGTVVEFEDGDFNDPATGEITAALTSLADVLERRLFSEWDETQIGNVAAMTRDEMLEVIRTIDERGPNDDGTWPHNISEEELRPVVEAAIAKRLSVPSDEATTEGPRFRVGRGSLRVRP